jgi:hypothetical protein
MSIVSLFQMQDKIEFQIQENDSDKENYFQEGI